MTLERSEKEGQILNLYVQISTIRWKWWKLVKQILTDPEIVCLKWFLEWWVDFLNDGRTLYCNPFRNKNKGK